MQFLHKTMGLRVWTASNNVVLVCTKYSPLKSVCVTSGSTNPHYVWRNDRAVPGRSQGSYGGASTWPSTWCHGRSELDEQTLTSIRKFYDLLGRYVCIFTARSRCLSFSHFNIVLLAECNSQGHVQQGDGLKKCPCDSTFSGVKCDGKCNLNVSAPALFRVRKLFFAHSSSSWEIWQFAFLTCPWRFLRYNKVETCRKS